MKTINVRGVRMAVDDVGAGPPVLLVHGFPLSRKMWMAQIEALASDHRVIAPDLRGFGDSETTAGVVRMEQYADDLAGLLDALAVPTPVTLAGLSMGGYIALAFWRRHAARLRALILLDTRSAADTPESAVMRRQSADVVERAGTEELIAQMMAKVLAPDTAVEQPEVARRLRALMAGNGPVGVSAALRGMAVRADSTDDLKDIDLPVLVGVGDADAITPPGEMRRMADALPQAEYVEIPNAGHLAPLENPAAVNAAIRAFLTRSA